jgi:hypothetical protein
MFDLSDPTVREHIDGSVQALRRVRFEQSIVGREDAIALVETLLKSGLVPGLHCMRPFDQFWGLNSSRTGYVQLDNFDHFPFRLTKLTLGPLNQDYTCYRVPPQIANLVHLRRLTLRGNCVSIAAELSNCPSLIKMKFIEFRIDGSLQLPDGLQSALFIDTDTSRLEHMMECLRDPPRRSTSQRQSNKPPATESLRCMKFLKCTLEEDHIESLLFDVLPNYPNIEHLSFYNNAQPFSSIATRLSNEDTSHLPKNLRWVELINHFPSYSKYRSNEKYTPELNESLTIIAKYLPRLEYMCLSKNDYHPQVSYWLKLNQAGRCLIDGYHYHRPDENGNHYPSVPSPPPQGLWPIVLARLTRQLTRQQTDRCENYDGIYYLLRNSPALCGRSDLGWSHHLPNSS